MCSAMVESYVMSHVCLFRSLAAVCRFINTTGDVFHIEKDKYHPGYTLFAGRRPTKTTNGSSATVVSGDSDSGGYVEDIEEAARFRLI